MKRMLINATQKEELRVALVDGQRLYDLDIETVNAKQKKSNIYKGKITRVEPSLEAAFVDYGADRHGFLPIKEIASEYFSGSTNVNNNGKADYKKLIPEGTEVMVQVDKEERGNKGAALTTYIGLAGRYLVLMPNNARGGGVSRRIQGSERKELKETLEQVEVPGDAGLIIRTAGVGRSKEELQWDMDYQMQVWSAITEAYDQVEVGALLYQESNIIVRALRDYFRDDIEQIIIDDEQVYQRAHAFMSLVMPNRLKRLHFYQDELPLFTRYQIEAQIDSAYGRNVRLPSGGELVIDYTEAMVSIDINSAKSTKGGNVEETAFNTNIEAAEEISRQLRLRDIGGLIVVDFIDMYESRHRKQVEDRMKSTIQIDRARVQISRISKFGLLEMSRQRLRPSIDEASHKVCPRCKGQGSIRSTQSIALSVLRLIEEDANKENTAKVVVQLPAKVATFLLNEKRGAIALIEKSNSAKIVIVTNDTLDTPNYDIQRIRNDDESTDGIVSYKLVRDFNHEDETAVVEQKEEKKLQEAVVSNIEPNAPPPKAKIGFFRLVKKVLGIGSSDTDVVDFNDTKKPVEKVTNRENNRNGRSDNRRKKPAFEGKSEGNRKPVRRTPSNVKNNSEDKRGKSTQASVAKKPSESSESKRQERRPRAKKETGKTESPEKSNVATPPKPFVNKYVKDSSKVRQGRPVSEDAVRGAGKFGSELPKAVVSEESNDHIDATGNSKVQGAGKSKIKKDAKDSSSKSNNERVWIPRAVGDAVPALRMSDDLDIPEEAIIADPQDSQAQTKSEVESEAKAKQAAKKATPATKSKGQEPFVSSGNKIADLSLFGQSVWLDNINRDMIESGELERLINEDDLRGITSNPAIFEKALASDHPGYLSYLQEIKSSVDSPKSAFFALAVRDIAEACQAMKATYDKTQQTDGMVSLEVSPEFAYDAEKTIEEALILSHKLNQENAMIKVPGTEAGLVAIEQLTYQGININVTLLFSVERYVEVFKAYMRGLQKRAEMGLPVENVRSVASFFISRIDAMADPILTKSNPSYKGKVAIANARLAYAEYLRLIDSPEWQRLEQVGASPQRLLWASTSTKDPDFSDVLYVDALIGKNTVNTIPPVTYAAFKDHGLITETIIDDVAEARHLIDSLPEYGIDLDLITQKLERDGVIAFEQSFETLLAVLKEKMKG